jgi:hypothetical protein
VAFPLARRLGGLPLKVEADVLVNGSLESVGRRVALFGRLLDEYANGNLLTLLDQSSDYVSAASEIRAQEQLKVMETLPAGAVSDAAQARR